MTLNNKNLIIVNKALKSGEGVLNDVAHLLLKTFKVYVYNHSSHITYPVVDGIGIQILGLDSGRCNDRDKTIRGICGVIPYCRRDIYIN